MGQARDNPRAVWRACTGEIVHAGEYWCGTGWLSKAVVHPFDGLFYVVSGKARIWVDGREHQAGPGDLFYMLRGQRIQGSVKAGQRIRTLSTGFRVDVAGAMSLLAWRAVPDKVRLASQDGHRLVGLFRALIKAVNGGRGEADLEALSRLLFLLHESLLHAGPEQMPSDKGGMERAANDRGSLVLGMIEREMSGEITLEKMARWASLSVGQFSRWFSGRMGVTPMRYVRQRRIERAKVLLGEGQLTVAEAAKRVGFEDTQTFLRAFKKATGGPARTPGWRKAGKTKRGRA